MALGTLNSYRAVCQRPQQWWMDHSWSYGFASRVLDVGHHSNGYSKEFHTIATSFHTAAGETIIQREKKEPVCTYCKGPHTTNQCTAVKGHQQRVSIVKLAGLCYNCVAHHRVSQCTFHRCCKRCIQKHHTSLCSQTDPKSPQPSSFSSQSTDSTQPSSPRTTKCQLSLLWPYVSPHHHSLIVHVS